MKEDAESMLTYFVVDDDTAFREKLCEMLVKKGNKAHPFANGSAALKLDGVIPDRVILDLRMPGESGLSILPKLHERFPLCEIVLLTGFGSISAAVDCIKMGAKNFITKPVGLPHILKAFEESSEPTPPVEAFPSLEEVEWSHIQRVLDECGGNISKAAKVLGIHRRSLQRKLARRPV